MGLFEPYFRASLGSHDGVRVRVLDKAKSPLVSVHEAIHEQIFAETPDGQVVAAFAGALREKLVFEEDFDAVQESVQRIFAESRDAHEVFANYLSIKVLPAAAEVQYLGELHDRYREYYDQLAGLIDENVPTSFLQYLVGWAFAVAVFSSNLIERVGEIERGTLLILTPEERPSERLVQLLNTLRQHDLSFLRGFLHEVAEKECQRQGFEPWDFLSEEAWMQRTYEEGRTDEGTFVEEAISRELRAWLRGIVPFPYLPEERQHEAFSSFSEMASSRFGMEIQDIHSLIDLDTLNIATSRRAIYQSRSRVKNSNPIRLPYGDSESLAEYENWQNFVAVGIYSACPPDNCKTWLMLFWTEDPEHHGAACSFTFDASEVGAFLQSWSEHREHGDKVPNISAVVIAIHGLHEYPEILQAYPYLLAEGIRERVAWYLWNGIYEMIHAFRSAEQPLYFGRIEMAEYEPHRGQLSQLEYDGMVIVLIQTTETPTIGVFVRAMRHQAFGSLSALIITLVKEGKSFWIAEHLQRDMVSLGREALAVAETFWDEY